MFILKNFFLYVVRFLTEYTKVVTKTDFLLDELPTFRGLTPPIFLQTQKNIYFQKGGIMTYNMIPNMIGLGKKINFTLFRVPIFGNPWGNNSIFIFFRKNWYHCAL